MKQIIAFSYANPLGYLEIFYLKHGQAMMLNGGGDLITEAFFRGRRLRGWS